MKKVIFPIIAALFCLSAMGQEWRPVLTEKWEPVPPVVTPGTGTAPPSDAIVLFDGTSFDNWEATGRNVTEIGWTLSEGAMTVVPRTGGIRTKQSFGDMQLHIEWRTPVGDEGTGQGRGNSGVFLNGLYEIQVLDSYENETYSNGQAASMYKQHIPLVNACRPPGEWQTYDVIYTAPRFKDDGTLFTPATVTLLHNGILVLNHVVLRGPTVFNGLPEYEAHDLKTPLTLQNHTDEVSYRNIWVREL
jgi:hypothetical protein